MDTDLPTAGRVAWWGTACLRGLVSPDDYVAAASGPHGVPGTALDLLAAARSAGATAFGAAFPRPGDPFGLAGPAQLTAAATDAGQAVLALGVRVEPAPAWVPHEVGRAVEWTAYDARRRVPPDPGEADRELRRTLLGAAEELARLDVARWRPEVADALHDLRAGAPVTAPPGVPARCADLARRALHLLAVVDLALDDEGGAVSASEAVARREAIMPLGAAARRALTAACSPDGWPDA